MVLVFLISTDLRSNSKGMPKGVLHTISYISYRYQIALKSLPKVSVLHRSMSELVSRLFDGGEIESISIKKGCGKTKFKVSEILWKMAAGLQYMI